MTQTVAILDYGSGNLRSVEKAFERAVAHGGMDFRVLVTDDPAIIRDADRLVLPGVGAFGACMEGLCARIGMPEALLHGVLLERRPFLGICVGMQLLATEGFEFDRHDGLGWISGTVRALSPSPPTIRMPHMGWNGVHLEQPHPVLEGLDGNAFYFAHSYYFEPENEHDLYAVTDYGRTLPAAIGRDNLFGVQFHPEKSQRAGIALIENFLNWTP